MKELLLTAFFLSAGLCMYAQPVTLRIDPSKAYGGTASEYFKQVEYIPLETTKESLFGDVSQMLVTDSGFTVFDRDTKAVLFFAENGKFIRKISMGSAYTRADLVKYKGEVVVGCSAENGDVQIRRYTQNGTLLTSKNSEDRNSFSQKFFTPLPGGFYAEFNRCDGSYDCTAGAADSVVYLVDIYRGDSLYKHLLPYNACSKRAFCKLAGGLASSLTMKLGDDAFYAAAPLENIIYKITVDTALAAYQVIFPKKYDIDRTVFSITDAKYLDSLLNNGAFYTALSIQNINDIAVHNNVLLFRLSYFSGIAYENGSPLSRHFIYNLSDGKLSAFERMTGDSSNFYLPLFYEQATGSTAISYYKNKYYTYASSLDMFAAYEANKFRKPEYPPSLQAYFKTQSRKSNPVIIKLKLKE